MKSAALAAAFVACAIAACSQKMLATFSVDLPANDHQIPVHADLDAVTFAPDSMLAMTEILPTGEAVAVNIQVDHGPGRQLHWIAAPRSASGKRIYRLMEKNNPAAPPRMTLDKNEKAVIIRSGSRNLLQYNHATVYPPEGIDPSYRRSAFIHPLWSPHGQVLTRIHPPGHHHHYGIWNPWTHLLFEGDTLDLWNLGTKQGTVRFAGFVSLQHGPVFAGYSARHEHVAFRDGTETILMNELQTVRVYHPENDAYYIADIIIQLSCASASPVRLLKYRYGGLAWRPTEAWNKHNSAVLTSEGMTRRTADGSKARWCIVQGATGNDHAGIVLMSHPANYNHPEPLRIWPEDQHERGELLVNISPTKDRDWMLSPGMNHVLRYRFIVFNGRYDKERAERCWQQFAHTPGSIAASIVR